ncbi:MAG: transglycosylase domain-containing protein [Ilumatobacteraceae bacterium]
MNPHLRLLTRLVLVTIAGALFIASVVSAIAPQAWGVLNAHSQTPVKLPQFSGLAQRSYLYGINGEQVGVFQLENIQPTLIDDVPEPVIGAILAVEDSGFYTHDGVNLRASVRALLSNFESSSNRQGASTITQQVVKNEYLAGLARDGRYKVLQARYAVMLENDVPKRQILERYLNTVYFGNNAYGLQAAAEVYFGIPVAELSLVQGVFLAGLIQAPSTYDPILHPERSRQRFKIALSRLVNTEMMTLDEATDLGETWNIPEVVKSVPQRNVNRTYFTEEVKDWLLNRSEVLGRTYQDRYNKLFRGGLKIYTTLDMGDQAAAEKASTDKLPHNKIGIQAAVLSIDNTTGGIRAMVGGPGFMAGRSEVNLAMRRRQTGSSVKMFVLAAALQAGIQPDDLIDGTLPCTLPNPGKPEEPFKITKGVSRGVAPLRIMTALSINCAYAKLSQVVGLERVVSTMYRMMDSEWTNPDAYRLNAYASLVTGANELSTLDMASGAQTIANGGLHMRPYMIERIEDAQGVLYEHVPEGIQAIPTEIANTTVDILKGVLKIGTARRTPLEQDRPAGGKTGTQDDNTNAWFVGFTKQLTTAVWVGDPKGYTPMVNIPEFVKVGVQRVQGAMFPAQIWKQYMDAAHANLPIVDWDLPPEPSRPAARIYLPGTECLAQVISGTIPNPVTTVTGRTSTTTTVPAGEDGGVVVDTVTDTVVVSVLDPGTTIAPTDTNPYSPVPTISIGSTWVYNCARPFPPSVHTSIAGG